jgi:hypothetical protein
MGLFRSEFNNYIPPFFGDGGSRNNTMSTQNKLPMRGKDIETRPIYVEEWLDSLPYIDFSNTIMLLQQALQAINAVPMKSTQRMEIVTLFHRPYKYYLDTQIRTGAQHTMQSMEMMQNQLSGLKSVAVQLGRASRLAMDEALSHKSLWGQHKYPLQEILMTMTYLSHALIYSFLEYAPAPQKVWHELNFLYQFAENITQHQTPVKLVATSKKDVTSIEKRYKRIALIALADPYHLPFGAIWEIYEQLHEWTNLAELKPLQKVNTVEGYFVINLTSDTSPLPYVKFNTANSGENYRLLDTNKLLEVIRKHIQKLKPGTKQEGLTFSPFYAEYLLRIINKAWSTPPKRHSPRKPRSGQMSLMHGLNTMYYFLNGEHDFKIQNDDRQLENDVGTFNTAIDSTTRYRKENWNLVDTCSGGIAVTRDDKPKSGVRVGDIVGLNLDEKNGGLEFFRAGILRWMLVRQGKIYKAGIQIFNQPVSPASVRASHGNQMEREFRRAILTGNPLKQKDITVFTSKGLHLQDRVLEININDKIFKGKVGEIIESTTCFEQFELKLQ